eukprot:CAMPEP_0177790574 /NCGR_PEP_ID=MMETSP0491_2-20121128/23436_1 /TAXON_ID=63592 /ORGANISM="Tetraselmis chuii, Strain PLY429" /LENGTH=56 /DNA_ID=CAMNT_0019312675 /DNA_START=127 /DNA_END=294 /DNA_ORIENTATION=-
MAHELALACSEEQQLPVATRRLHSTLPEAEVVASDLHQLKDSLECSLRQGHICRPR